MSVLNILTMGRKQPLFSVIFFQTKCPTFAKAWGRDISRCVINIWPRWSLMRSATSDRDPIEAKLMRPELYTYRYVLNSLMIYFRYNDISMCSRAEHAGYLILKRPLSPVFWMEHGPACDVIEMRKLYQCHRIQRPYHAYISRPTCFRIPAAHDFTYVCGVMQRCV